jgi:hypothetical protein
MLNLACQILRVKMKIEFPEKAFEFGRGSEDALLPLGKDKS